MNVGPFPPCPSGSSREAAFHRASWMANYGGMMRVLSSPTVRVSRTTRGQIAQARSRAIGSSRAVVEEMTLQELVSYNCMKCRPDGAASDGSEDVYAATPPDVRSIILEEVLDGETWTYTYPESWDGTQSRSATNGVVTVTQVITPRWVVGNRVTVADCRNIEGVILAPSGARLSKVIFSGREWAEQYSA